MTAMPREMMGNAVRRLAQMFPGYFPEAKHNHYRDFGWPETLTFAQFYRMYCRNSLASAAIKKTARKCWESYPALMEREDQHDETSLEKEIRQRFADLRVWQHAAETDRRSMVGRYAGLILRLADDKRFREPVDSVPGGLDALVEVIPAWEGQLTVSTWDTDETSEDYGKPTMYLFNEAQVSDGNQGQNRSFEVHPDRVIIWSETGTVHDQSLLEACYNDLLDMEKIRGAGGEGFWKNAKSAPILEMDPATRLDQMAQAMDVEVSDLKSAMDEQVSDYNKGFDPTLLLQGITAKTLGVTLPSPEHFYGIALQSAAASFMMPVKIFVGMQTGERASQEDAREWAQTCMGRRSDALVPVLMEFVNRLERFGIIPERDWFLDWADLTESGMDEKIARVERMASVNDRMRGSRELVFTPEEMRDVIDLAPLSEKERTIEGDAAPFGESPDEE